MRVRGNSGPEPVPEPEDLNLAPDGRDPRPENIRPCQSSGLWIPLAAKFLPSPEIKLRTLLALALAPALALKQITLLRGL